MSQGPLWVTYTAVWIHFYTALVFASVRVEQELRLRKKIPSSDIIGVRQSRWTRLVSGLHKAWTPNPVCQFGAGRINYHTNPLPFNQIVILSSLFFLTLDLFLGRIILSFRNLTFNLFHITPSDSVEYLNIQNCIAFVSNGLLHLIAVANVMRRSQ